jgi:FSR family fosmidomycin resistance protein-like MFS transporter
VLVLGLPGGLLLAIPGLAIALFLASEASYLRRFLPVPGSRVFGLDAVDRPRAFALLLVIISLRSVPHMGLFTFVPLWEVANGATDERATVLLALFLFGGAIGTLIGGPLADRIGRKPVMVGSYAATVPLIVVYVLVGGVVGDVALFLSGATVICTFGVSVVMSQEYMPRRIGLASGLCIGLAIGLGGVFAAILGSIADAIDLQAAMLATAVAPAIGAVLALGLPPAHAARLVERAATSPT